MSTVDLTPLRAQVELLRFVKQRKAELAELEASARGAIEEALGDAGDEGEVDGHTVITWRHFKRTALDQKELARLHPDAYEECKKTTEVRRFEILGD